MIKNWYLSVEYQQGQYEYILSSAASQGFEWVSTGNNSISMGENMVAVIQQFNEDLRKIKSSYKNSK